MLYQMPVGTPPLPKKANTNRKKVQLTTGCHSLQKIRDSTINQINSQRKNHKVIPHTKILILDLKGWGFRAYSLRFITMYLPCFLHFSPAVYHWSFSEDIYLKQTYCLVQHDHGYGLLVAFLKRLRSALAVTPYFSYFLSEEMLQSKHNIRCQREKTRKLHSTSPIKASKQLSVQPCASFHCCILSKSKNIPFYFKCKIPILKELIYSVVCLNLKQCFNAIYFH